MFICKNGLSSRWKISVGQNYPLKLIDKLVSYIINAWRFPAKYNYLPGNLIALDETAVWTGRILDTTVDNLGVRTIILKSTGHEKCCVSVCLTVKAGESKLKPFIVFKNA